MKALYLIIVLCSLALVSCKKETTCQDPNAINYGSPGYCLTQTWRATINSITVEAYPNFNWDPGSLPESRPDLTVLYWIEFGLYPSGWGWQPLTNTSYNAKVGSVLNRKWNANGAYSFHELQFFKLRLADVDSGDSITVLSELSTIVDDANSNILYTHPETILLEKDGVKLAIHVTWELAL